MAEPSTVECPGCFQDKGSGGAICPECVASQKKRTENEREDKREVLPIGTQLGNRYLIGKMLGGGGFGITYLGFQVELGRRVAIKEYLPIRCAKRDPKSRQVIPSEDESYADIFQRGAKAFLDEARILGSLDHPNVVDVIDRFKRDGTAYLVMKYYEGSVELGDYCARQYGGKLPWRRTIKLFLPVLAGLEKVHDKDLMHRDIKPGNLLHLPDPEDKLILIDFGLARAVDRERDHSFAIPGVAVVGTARYAAPEQWLNLQPIYGKPSSKSDIYGVAATLYHLLASERPMTAEERLLAKVHGRGDPLPPARRFIPDLPAKLDDALQKALELKQENRFESVAEFARVLRAVLQQELPQELPPKKPGMWERFFGKPSQPLKPTSERPAQPPPPAVLKPLQVFRDRLKDGSEGPAMIVIPRGTFLMGSPEGERERSKNEWQHKVTVGDFAIGQYTVTFAEYDRFCDATKRKKPNDQGWGREMQPVICVSWHDAWEYVVWLCKETGCRYRLPTEAEWEYAARAGTTGPFWTGRCVTTDQVNYNGRYSYGEPDCGAKTGVFRQKTLPVGSFKPNPWGLYDTMGNVWEWTCAEEKCSASSPLVRGGSWYTKPAGARSAARLRIMPASRNSNQGFRLARSL